MEDNRIDELMTKLNDLTEEVEALRSEVGGLPSEKESMTSEEVKALVDKHQVLIDKVCNPYVESMKASAREGVYLAIASWNHQKERKMPLEVYVLLLAKRSVDDWVNAEYRKVSKDHPFHERNNPCWRHVSSEAEEESVIKDFTSEKPPIRVILDEAIDASLDPLEKYLVREMFFNEGRDFYNYLKMFGVSQKEGEHIVSGALDKLRKCLDERYGVHGTIY